MEAETGWGAGRPVWEEMLGQSLGGADGRQEGQARLGVAQAGPVGGLKKASLSGAGGGRRGAEASSHSASHTLLGL